LAAAAALWLQSSGGDAPSAASAARPPASCLLVTLPAWSASRDPPNFHPPCPPPPFPQIYHEDKGYDDRSLVFLSPLPPTLAIRRVLLTHPHCSKMLYLQGSPFRRLVGGRGRGPGQGQGVASSRRMGPRQARQLKTPDARPTPSPARPLPTPRHPTPPHPTPPHPTPPHPTPPQPQDLERTQVEYAEAVFIVADKHAHERAAEDRRHTLALLSVGQYLAVRRHRGGEGVEGLGGLGGWGS
jgi:hypothetical protein